MTLSCSDIQLREQPVSVLILAVPIAVTKCKIISCYIVESSSICKCLTLANAYYSLFIFHYITVLVWKGTNYTTESDKEGGDEYNEQCFIYIEYFNPHLHLLQD